MNITETIWYEARSIDGTHRRILDGEYFKTCRSEEEVRQALDRSKPDSDYLICRVTYRTTKTKSGELVRQEKTLEAVSRYILNKGLA